MQKETLVWHAEVRSVSSLKSWTYNPRKISPEKLEQLMGRIRNRGFHDVVKIDQDGTIAWHGLNHVGLFYLYLK